MSLYSQRLPGASKSVSSSTPTLLSQGDAPTSMAVYVNTGSITVYLGDSVVTATTGIPLTAGASYSEQFDAETALLYGLAASGTGTVVVMTLESGSRD